MDKYQADQYGKIFPIILLPFESGCGGSSGKIHRLAQTLVEAKNIPPHCYHNYLNISKAMRQDDSDIPTYLLIHLR